MHWVNVKLVIQDSLKIRKPIQNYYFGQKRNTTTMNADFPMLGFTARTILVFNGKYK